MLSTALGTFKEATSHFGSEQTERALVLEDALFIAQNSKNVKIDFQQTEEVAKKLHEVRLQGGFSLKTWKTHPLNPKVANEEALDWIFLVDTLNFSFWHREENGIEQIYEVEWDGKKWTGYWALCAVVQRALHEGIPITSAEFMANVDLPTLEHIFRSSNGVACPMLEKRKWALNEAGSVLLDYFDGKFANVVKEANHSAKDLIELVLQNFSSYRDESFYSGRKVRFWKRVQILVADIWACFENEGFGEFQDIDCLTMFADYRVPQVLVHLGIMKYDDELLEILKTNPYLPANSHLEIQIRGNSIFAVEVLTIMMRDIESKWMEAQIPDHLNEYLVKSAVKRLESKQNRLTDDAQNNDGTNKEDENNPEDILLNDKEYIEDSKLVDERLKIEEELENKLGPLNAVIIDFYLWDYAKRESEAMKDIPIHKTTTHYY